MCRNWPGYYSHTRVEAVRKEYIIANHSHYLVGVPYEGENFF